MKYKETIVKDFKHLCTVKTYGNDKPAFMATGDGTNFEMLRVAYGGNDFMLSSDVYRMQQYLIIGTYEGKGSFTYGLMKTKYDELKQLFNDNLTTKTTL